MNSKSIFTLLLMYFSTLAIAQTTLPSTKEVHAQAENYMKLIVKGEILTAFNSLKPNWPISEAGVNGLADQTVEQLPLLNDTYGKLIGYEFVRSETLGNFAHIEFFVLKYEYSALRFYFSYYSPGKGWYLNSMMWDENWELLYKDKIK